MADARWATTLLYIIEIYNANRNNITRSSSRPRIPTAISGIMSNGDSKYSTAMVRHI